MGRTPHGGRPHRAVPYDRRVNTVDPRAADNGYAAALSRNELYADLGLRRTGDVLEPSERALLALPAVASDAPTVLIVTDSRVVLSRVGGWRARAKALRSIPAAKVRGVEYQKGAFTRLRLLVDGERDLRLLPHRKDDAERFAGELDHLLRTGSLPG